MLGPCRHLGKRGFEVTIAPVRRDGTVELDTLAAALGDDTLLLSIQAANNEVGTIQPLAAAAPPTSASRSFTATQHRRWARFPSMWKRWVWTSPRSALTSATARRASVLSGFAAVLPGRQLHRSGSAAATNAACGQARPTQRLSPDLAKPSELPANDSMQMPKGSQPCATGSQL